MRFVDPEHTRNDLHERSLRAAELHEMKVALQKNKDLTRADRKVSSRATGRRYLRPFVRRVSRFES
jgi:hypothetical protein